MRIKDISVENYRNLNSATITIANRAILLLEKII